MKLNKMKKAPVSVRLVNFLTQILFWWIVVLTVFVFVINVLLLTGQSFGDNFQLRIQLPVTFSVNEVGSVDLFGAPNDISLESATSQVHIVDTPRKLSAMLARVVFLVLLVALFIVWKFKSFIYQIKNGQIFMKENIRNLKHIAFGLLGLWLIINVYLGLLYHAIFKFAEFQTITFSGVVNYQSELIVGAILLWILAHIFEKGVEMKEEQALTI